MKLVIKKRALNAILSTAIYVESMNTEGSGERWADKIKTTFIALAKSTPKLAICKNASLAKFSYRCFSYKDWVIAYRIKKDTFEICRFIHGSRLH